MITKSQFLGLRMQERLDAAFLFGSLGNLQDALGDGWSVEDNFAWAVGDESVLNLPLPGDDGSYRVRLTVHPLVHHGVRDVQRLTVATPAGSLASFSIDRNTTVDFAIPPEQTRHRRQLALHLHHPDALQPSAFKHTADTRLLSLCFLSGALVREIDLDAASATAPSTCHLILAGDSLAHAIAKVIDRLPSLRQRVACHFVDGCGAGPPSDVVASATACWQQVAAAEAATTDLRARLPAECAVKRFYAPRMNALWPFLGADPRIVAETGRYPHGRYPFGDRLAASLAWLQLPDDVLRLAYDSMVDKELPNHDAWLAADATVWRRLDAATDVSLAAFILDNFRRARLHFAPEHPTGALLREIVLQLAADSPIAALCSPATLHRELDLLLTGYLGHRMELPIHPHVAGRFGLAWWHKDMRYRWHGNAWTFEEYIARYISWTPWQP